MLVKEIYSKDFHTISANSSIREAAEVMRKEDVGMLPVSQDGRLVGTLSDRDVAIRAVARGSGPAATVDKVMTAGVICCYVDEEIQQAARRMKHNQIRRLVVLNRKDEPIGVLALADLASIGEDRNLTGEVVEQISKPNGHPPPAA